MRFSELFSAFGSTWPTEVINTGWPPSASVTGLLAQIDDAIRLHDVLTDIGPNGTISVAAKLKLAPGGPPGEVQLVTRLFPSFRFVFKPGLDWDSNFRCAVASDSTASVQIDSLPLDVLIPPDLLAEHPDTAKQGKDTKIELSDGAQHSVITRDFSLTLEAGGELRLDPHLPVSIGPCKLFGIPMIAVHDLVLVTSPSRAERLHYWIVRDLDPKNFPLDCGGLGFGGIEVDWEAEGSPLAELRSSTVFDDNADLVIEDVVIPAVFRSPFPQHGTLGLRRSLEPGETLEHHLSFNDAPLKIPLGDSATLFFDQLFFRTPPQDQPLSNGLSLEAGIAVSFGDGPNEDWDFSIGFIDGDLLRLSIARELPPAGTGELPIISLDLWAIDVQILRGRFGVYISELQKDEVDAGSAIQGIGDILAREKPDGDSQPVRPETEDGKPFELALVDVGWDHGKPSGSIAKAQGVTLTMGPFALELHQLGLIAEQGATYISVSGGIRQKTDPFEGKVWFERLRGRLAGNPDAPDFKLGGFGASLEIKDTVEIEVYGHFRNDLLTDGTRIKEHGLGGKIVIHVGDNEWGLSLDVYWGERIPPVEARIDYLLFQVALFGAIPMGPVELRGIEAIYADSLLPKIKDGDREAGELKYYPWLKKSRPTALPEDRGLSAWTPENDAWAFGAGLSVSFVGCGELCLASAFALGFEGAEKSGLIVVLELKILGGDKPIAIGIIEYDFRRDAFVIQLNVDLKLEDLIDNFPEELKVKIGGTITIGNKPGLVAIGRLGDQDTWLGAKIELDLSNIAELKIRIALCFEWLEGEYVGGGFIFSLSVKGDLAVIRLEGWGSLLVLLRFMLTGTNDFVARILFEMGFALVLFGFLRFGISMSLLAEWLAHTPNFFMFRATFRLETPWFLPDVSVTVECTRGTLAPASRSMLTGALLEGSAESRAGTRRTRVRRIDGLAGGEQPTLLALNALPANGPAFRGDADPVPLDGRIEIQFSQMLIDRLGIDSVNPDLGRQITGDPEGELKIDASYTLVGLEVRRRPVGTTAWTVIESITAPGDTRNGRWFWDADTRTGGETAPKKLIYHGATPFTVGQDNPLADAEILDENPNFPCCMVRKPDVARLDFCDDPPGALPGGFLRGFTFLRRGTLAPIRARGGPSSIRPPIQPGAKCPLVAAFRALGPILSLSAEEDLARIELRLSLIARALTLTIVARDADGEIVDRIDRTAGTNSPFETLILDPGRGIRTVDIWLGRIKHGDNDEGELNFEALELEWIECVTAADRAQEQADQDRCDRIDDEGHGELNAFLPRHEYDIGITTQVVIGHTNEAGIPRTITERVGFVTAGLPGLNETEEPGLELRPYVVSHLAGGRGLLYREESVHLMLSSDMTIFGPGPGGDDEAAFRLPVTLTVKTEFDTNPETGPSKASFESQEWFLANRAAPGFLVATPIHDLITALTDDPARLRYKALTEASVGTCPPDDIWNEPRPRLGVDPFDPSGRALWRPSTGYHAAMRPEGGPVVNRAPFEAADITAFDAPSGTFTVNAGELVATTAASGRFGEPEWDLFTAEALAKLDTTTAGSLSLGVLIAPTNLGGGIRITLDVSPGGAGTVSAAPVGGGPAFATEAIALVPDVVSLRVDVFADNVRASVAGATISLPRSGLEGGVCELGAANARIAALRVRALEMYGFSFRTSQYEGFEAHIASAGNTAGHLPIAAGAAEPLPGLVARLASEITAAMRPEADDAERERLFGEAAQALALPLREDPSRLHLELAESGTDRWLLLESPEPIDLVVETRVRLRRRVATRPIDRGLEKRLRDALSEFFTPRIVIPPRPIRPVLDRPFTIRRDIARPIPRDTAVLGDLGRDLVATTTQISPSLPIRDADAFLSVEFFRNRFLITLLKTEQMVTRPAAGLSRAEARALTGVVLFFDRAGLLVDWRFNDDAREWQAIGTVTIQSGDATKALLMPHSTGALPAGDYRIDFDITRKWFDTLAPLGHDNAYIRTASLPFLVS